MLKFLQRHAHNRSGFTLIETMLAVLIVSLISTVLYSVFANGVKIWHRSNLVKPEFEISIFLEQLENDIRNALSYNESPFKGKVNSMEFYSMRSSGDQGEAETVPEVPARIRYDFKAEVHAVFRDIVPYRDLLNRSEKSVIQRKQAQNISKCSFQYFKRINELQAPSWHSGWSDPCLPDAIKISIEYQDKKQMKILTKIIPVIAGGCAA